MLFQTVIAGASLAVQWLRLHAASARGAGVTPDQGTKTPHAMWHGQRIFKKNTESILPPQGHIEWTSEQL